MAHYTPQQLASLLEKALGSEPASMLVAEAVQSLGYNPEDLDTERALAVLDEIATQPGLPGVCARFAKARLHMVGQVD